MPERLLLLLMISFATQLVVHAVALLAALQFWVVLHVGRLVREASLRAAGAALDLLGKGTARCLHTALTVLGGGDGRAELGVLSYAQDAAAGIRTTVTTAFHSKSYWTALALLDISALWAVLRNHQASHKRQATAVASVRRAAADPADPGASSCGPTCQDLPLLQCAALHSKAAYGAPAAGGYVSSAVGYLSLITIHQATRKAPRRIPATLHLASVQQLTGCPPADVLSYSWQSHHHRPAYYVALDRQRRRLVVSIRGTLQLGDFCTVLNATPVPYTLCGIAGHVHAGFLAAARNLLAPVAATLRAAAAAGDCAGWPVLLTGHSLGGGVAAILSLMLIEERQKEQHHQLQHQSQMAAAAAGEQSPTTPAAAAAAVAAAAPEGQLSLLGDIHCVGIGAAAAFCELLGSSCRQHVTSVLFGADCLPMFSVLGARQLIEEVHQTSRAAAAVGSLLSRARRVRHSRSASASSSSCSASTGSPLARSVSTASSTASSLLSCCDVACGTGGGGCRGLCAASLAAAAATMPPPPECAVPDMLEGEIEEAVGAPPVPAGSNGGIQHRLQRCWSVWSVASTEASLDASTDCSASTSSLAAFAADPSCQPGPLVPMFPPGRILWLLPPAEEGGTASAPAAATPARVLRSGLLQRLRSGSSSGWQPAGSGSQHHQGRRQQRLVMVETNQQQLERFLLTAAETARVHLPDNYIHALASLVQ